MNIVGVRFKPAGKIYYFDPAGHVPEVGDHVVVETARGIEFGEVVIGERDVPEEELVLPLKPVLRLATEEDEKKHAENLAKKSAALRICEEKIANRGLDMKLVDMEYTFDNNKVIFYFTSDDRVDFRELVKDLASVFRVRIELRQIGVRDQAKYLGGVGCCGRELCCCKHLGDFCPVSIKMAKDQGLSLNPIKISGVCGRLMCCLKYEHEHYEEVLQYLPEIGEIVKTKMGTGPVVERNVVTEEVKVRIHSVEEGAKNISFNARAVKSTGRFDKALRQQKNEQDADVLDEREARKLE